MKVKIHIGYHTEWGESVFITGSIPQLGSGDKTLAPILEMTSPDIWSISLDIPADVKTFDYNFIVKAEGKPWREEWGGPHRFDAGQGISGTTYTPSGRMSRPTSLTIRRLSPRECSTAPSATSR